MFVLLIFMVSSPTDTVPGHLTRPDVTCVSKNVPPRCWSLLLDRFRGPLYIYYSKKILSDVVLASFAYITSVLSISFCFSFIGTFLFVSIFPLILLSFFMPSDAFHYRTSIEYCVYSVIGVLSRWENQSEVRGELCQTCGLRVAQAGGQRGHHLQSARGD